MIITLVILFFLLFIYILPIYVYIDISTFYDKTKNKFVQKKCIEDTNSNKKMPSNVFKIKVTKGINIYTYDFGKKIIDKNNDDVIKYIIDIYDIYKLKRKIKNEKEKKKNKEKNNKGNKNKFKMLLIKSILKSIYVSKLYLSLGNNIESKIYNSYLNAVFNASLMMYINKNQKSFNIKNLYYKVYISDSTLDISFNTVLKLNMYKIVFNMLKSKFKKSEIKIMFKKTGIY